MKPQELIRIIVLSLVGGLIMFLLQPLVYQNQIISLNLSNTSTWLNNYYMPGALIVFIVSVFSTILWCVLTMISKDYQSEAVAAWRPIWWIIGLLPILSIFVAIGFYRGDDSALLSLTFFYLIDILILYWLTTASSTPGNFKYLPPMSLFIRNLIGD